MSNSNWLGSNKKNFNQKDYDIQLNDALKIIGKHKTQINKIYESNIQKEAQIKNDYNNWRFNIYVNRKKDLIKSLFENKLFASSHYYSAGKMFEDKNFTNTDYVSDNIVNLFNDLRFDIKKAEIACEIINSHLTQFGTPSY